MSKDLVQPTAAPAEAVCDHLIAQKTLGQIAYEAATGQHAWSAGPWGDLPEFARLGWEAAAQAVRRATREECAAAIDVVAEMTTDPQATVYRFAAYLIRSIGSITASPQRPDEEDALASDTAVQLD